MKRWVLIALFLLLPLSSQAETINAGFVQGLWFSQQPIFVGDTVRVYVAIRNNTDAELSGRVSFYDNGSRFSRMNVNALDGRIVEGWADWTPTYGEHTISADLTDTEIDSITDGAQTASVTAALAETIVFIDYDTDGDDIGNIVDTDDDGDGVSDADETLAGTDPLVFDEPEQDSDHTDSDDTDATHSDDTINSAVNTKSSNSNSPAGLEQYLTPSPAHAAISSITNTINTTKERLDSYRDARTRTTDNTESPTEQSTTDNQVSDTTEDGLIVISDDTTDTVGEITRSVEPQESWLGTVVSSVVSTTVRVFDSMYTWILFGISWLLGHPILVQILFLCLLLFILFKIAHRWSSRPE